MGSKYWDYKTKFCPFSGPYLSNYLVKRTRLFLIYKFFSFEEGIWYRIFSIKDIIFECSEKWEGLPCFNCKEMVLLPLNLQHGEEKVYLFEAWRVLNWLSALFTRAFCLTPAILAMKGVGEDLEQLATAVRSAMIGGFKNCTKYSASYF